jgi:hypothetical protein
MTTPALVSVFMEMLPAGGRRPACLEDAAQRIIESALLKHGFDPDNGCSAQCAVRDAIMTVLSQARAQQSFQLNDQIDRLLTHGFERAAQAARDERARVALWIEEDRKRREDAAAAPAEAA